MLAFEKSVPRGSVMVGNANTCPVRARRQGFQPADTRLTEAFGIGHDVGLRHRHEISGGEKLADLDLMLQRLLADRALLAGEDILLLVGEPHAHWKRAVGHIGGATPRPTLTRGVVSVPSGCLVAAEMKIGTPAFSSLLSPGV